MNPKVLPQKKIHDRLSLLFTNLLEAKQKASLAHTDREIDKAVYALYGLTAEEIALVEGA